MGGPGLAPGTAAETPRQGAPSWAPVFCASWTTSFPALTGPRGQVPPPPRPPRLPPGGPGGGSLFWGESLCCPHSPPP